MKKKRILAASKNIQTESKEEQELVATVDNFEVVVLNNGNNFHALVEKLLEKIRKEEENEEKKEKSFDATDSIVTTIKELIKEFIAFFENDIDDLDNSEDGKITLKALSKLTVAISNKKYNKIEKLNKILKLVATVTLKTWQGQN